MQCYAPTVLKNFFNSPPNLHRGSKLHWSKEKPNPFWIQFESGFQLNFACQIGLFSC
ncbi:hypothetical protein HMPREF3213_02018 [Heyndrickxia coagulans]|uniref:Uncharacterized protein n=1 Tax=Heyndrickxia coagulans TaxID=1398 RepID=A0A133KPB4_HEYCO|nr:hypothetical protein HMPREF3213_02018 [Heyndrickxia coagulans]